MAFMLISGPNSMAKEWFSAAKPPFEGLQGPSWPLDGRAHVDAILIIAPCCFLTRGIAYFEQRKGPERLVLIKSFQTFKKSFSILGVFFGNNPALLIRASILPKCFSVCLIRF
jgi:hypothetical protein